MGDLLTVLKETMVKFRHQMINNTGDEILNLSTENFRLFGYVFGVYSAKTISGRWYDFYHMAYSTLFAVKLVESGQASPLVVPAIILHDIGWCSPFVDKESWTSKNSRIIHMQEGSAMTAEILSGRYTASEIGKIVGMVASHDNGYLGINTNNPDRLALRDADRAWVMHPISFYKDWIFKIQQGEKLSLLDLFQLRLASFYGPNETYPKEWGRSEKPDGEDAFQSPPFTRLAKKLRDNQFAARFGEIQNDITCDADKFREAIENHIRAELSVGRG